MGKQISSSFNLAQIFYITHFKSSSFFTLVFLHPLFFSPSHAGPTISIVHSNIIPMSEEKQTKMKTAAKLLTPTKAFIAPVIPLVKLDSSQSRRMV